jgi:glucosamine--fructose-6-phosphate aminotransferase (isomerizing)
MPRPFLGIILAAGKGTRFKSNQIKVLHKILNVPMICLIIDSLKKVNPDEIFVVICHQKEKVMETLSSYNVKFIEQLEPKGTAHALMSSVSILEKNKEKDLLVLYGDAPLVQPPLLEELINHHQKNDYAVTLVSAKLDSPMGYGRIIRDEKGNIVKIIEERDATFEEKRINEINAGIYMFKISELLPALNYVSPNNVKKEYYLPQLIEILRQRGKSIGEVKTSSIEDIFGINTRYELARAISILKERKIKTLCEQGVTFIDPDNTWIDLTVKIGKETVIYPSVILEEDTIIGDECTIYPFVHIINSKIGNKVKILSSSMIEDSIIEDEAQIGPFTHLRPKTIIKNKAKVGNFVEMKKTIFGSGSKAGHLSYLGDSEVGENVNIGAGTITCNFDGFKKHKTIIEEGAFIGSGTELVAPVKVGKNSFIGAGSTITKNVEPFFISGSKGKANIKAQLGEKKEKKQIMCGIIGYLGPKKISTVLIDGLKRLEYRGYDSAGLAVVNKGKLEIRRVKGKISKLEELIRISPIDGSYGIGHTRWATHGRPSEENAHPHRDCTGTIVVVHNGIIENYLSLKKELSKEGHNFQTETDTEAIAHLIEKYYQGDLENAVQRTVRELNGVFAFAVISSKEKEKIVVAKKGPPAIVGLGNNEYFVCSDLAPILSHTREVVFLDDEEMAVIDNSGARFSDFSGKTLSKSVHTIAWDPIMVEKGGFKHFMLKEIFEQPRALRETLIGRISLDTGKIYLDEINISEEVLRKLNRINIIACGSSYHAGLVGKYFLENLAKIPVEVDYSSEYRYRDFVLNKNQLNIIITQSGETADTLAALRIIRNSKGKTLTICNMKGSTATREADGVIYTHAGPEIGVASTKTFSSQLMALALFSLYIAQIKDNIDKTHTLFLLQELQKIPHKIESILYQAPKIEKLAQKFANYTNFLYLGRWVNFPIALEGALKLKEISYIHAEGYPAGEMKHGPIALIEERMPTVAVVPKDRVYEKMLSNISEVKTRNGIVIAVAFEKDNEIKDKVDEFLLIPSTHQLFTPFLTVVPLQLFAYYIALRRGADVDQPRNLAKSVTVE